MQCKQVVLQQLQLFSTFWGLKLCMLIFMPTEQLSRTLQKKDITVQEAINVALVTESFLQKQRSDSAFDSFYEAVVAASQNLTDEPVLPRKRKIPRRLDDRTPSHHPSTPTDLYRQKYFQVLDVVCEEIKRRFDHLKIVADTESLLLDSANGMDRDVPQSIVDMYSGDMDMARLTLHLKMLPDIVKQYGYTVGLPIKKVTSIRTLCDALSTGGGKQLLSQVHTLLQLFLTIPVTIATSERTFSALRRLKTYLRTTMAQDHLNHLLLLYCHKARTNAVDL
jgi:hypothetical protein